MTTSIGLNFIYPKRKESGRSNLWKYSQSRSLPFAREVKKLSKIGRLIIGLSLSIPSPRDFSIIQLGDHKEPILKNVTRFAGKHTMRESAALLSQANFFIGPDSLLMHVANGLKIKSIVIFGGSDQSTASDMKRISILPRHRHAVLVGFTMDMSHASTRSSA